jgi:thioredoxin reductase (NADPH)
MERIYDTIIIGGGPAGYSAALYSSRAGLETLVIEKMTVGGQMALTGDIDNYPGFESGVDGFTLGMKMQSGAERFGAMTEYAEVLAVDFSQKIKRIETTLGAYQSRTVILATGAEPRKLGLENEDALLGRGVHYCAHCDGRFYKDKTVAVVGGGNSAVTDALYLARIAKKVYLIHRRGELRASKIYRDALLEKDNVELIYNSRVEELLYDSRLFGVKLSSTESGNISDLLIDALFVGIGREPVSRFLSGQLEIDKNGYVIAGEDTKTSIDGVFAVGDLRTKKLRQVVTAVADGAVAAYHAEEYISLM